MTYADTVVRPRMSFFSQITTIHRYYWGYLTELSVRSSKALKLFNVIISQNTPAVKENMQSTKLTDVHLQNGIYLLMLLFGQHSKQVYNDPLGPSSQPERSKFDFKNNQADTLTSLLLLQL